MDVQIAISDMEEKTIRSARAHTLGASELFATIFATTRKL
jgi:hypothetical protein